MTGRFSISLACVVCAAVLQSCGGNKPVPKNGTTTQPANTTSVVKIDTAKQKMNGKENELFKIAAKYQKRLMFTQAIQAYDSMLTLDPQNQVAFDNIATIYYTLGQKDSAAAVAERALRANSTDYLAHYYVGMVDLYYRNNARKAVVEFSSCVTSQKNFSDGYDRRGVAYSSLGDTINAFKDFDTALHYNPRNDMAYYNRGILYGMLQHTDLEFADYKKAISLNPNNLNALMNMGVIKEKTFKDYKGAIADFTKIIGQDETNAKAYYNRAKARRGLNDNKGAIEDLTKAIKIKPDYRQAYLQRADIYRSIGDKVRADKDMKSGLQH